MGSPLPDKVKSQGIGKHREDGRQNEGADDHRFENVPLPCQLQPKTAMPKRLPLQAWQRRTGRETYKQSAKIGSSCTDRYQGAGVADKYSQEKCNAIHAEKQSNNKTKKSAQANKWAECQEDS